jgi:hypothetical protein
MMNRHLNHDLVIRQLRGGSGGVDERFFEVMMDALNELSSEEKEILTLAYKHKASIILIEAAEIDPFIRIGPKDFDNLDPVVKRSYVDACYHLEATGYLERKDTHWLLTSMGFKVARKLFEEGK